MSDVGKSSARRTDRYSSRHLLFGYYSLRGMSLLFLPFTLQEGGGGLAWLAVFCGLDWIATVPPTVRLTSEAFGRGNTTIEVVGRGGETPGTTVEPIVVDAFDSW